MAAQEPDGALWLLGFRFGGSTGAPTYYTIHFVSFEDAFNDTPYLDDEGHLIVSQDPARLAIASKYAARLLGKVVAASAEGQFVRDGQLLVPECIDAVYDLGRIAGLAFGEVRPFHAWDLLDFLNIVGDCIDAMGLDEDESIRRDDLRSLKLRLFEEREINEEADGQPDYALRHIVPIVTPSICAILNRLRIV